MFPEVRVFRFDYIILGYQLSKYSVVMLPFPLTWIVPRGVILYKLVDSRICAKSCVICILSNGHVESILKYHLN